MPHPLTHGAPLLLGRSAYSFLRGTARPADLAAAAARGGHAALALVDRGNLCGAIDFLDAARHHGLQPILGAEWVVPLRILGGSSRDRGSEAGEARLILLCRDVVGYRTLCRLLSRLHLQGPEAAGRFLRSDPAGLIALAEPPEAWPPLREIFGLADLYGLLVRPGNLRDEHRTLQQATRQSIRVVASSNVFMVSPAEERTGHLLRAIRRHGFLAPAGASDARAARGGPTPTREPPGLLIDAAAMARRFADLPEALVRSRELIERCRLCLEDLTPGRFILPSLRGREGLGALRNSCEAGLARRGLLHSAAARERLATELRVVEILGFWDYFLVVGDIIGWARERGIRIVGRGSGAASIIAYLLGVTNVDPLREGLCFERFFHPLRRDLPDLDVDIAWDRREEVLRYALSRFGEGRAAIMGTHPAWRARGAFREAARALGLPDARIAEGCRRLPYAFFGEPQAPEGGAAEEGADARALRALVRDGAPDLARAARAALGLVGLPRHLGTHPGGVVLADRPLEEIVALQVSPAGFAVTQLEMRAAARVGLVKIDLLGNRSLGTIDETIRSIRAARVEGRANDGDGVASTGRGGANNGDGVASAGRGGDPGRAAAWAELDDIPDRDPRVAEMLARAETLGCLQLESPAMRTLLRQLGARDVGMLVAAIALIRPGPAGSGMKLAFVRRVRGLEEPLALHPALRPVLASTFGLPLYDEDVIAMAATIAGGTLAEGDLLRRAVAEGVRRAKAGDPGAEESLRRLERGFRRAAGAQGIDRRAAGEVWETLVRFAAYSFCKAHAAGYGLIAYQCAWLKAHFPGPFFAALLNHHRGMYPSRVYVEEARRAGLRLCPPCVGHGAAEWRWEPDPPGPGALRCGLGAVRGLHETTLRALLASRAAHPFRDLDDFAARVPASAPELEALVLCGAFDEVFGRMRGELIWRLHRRLRRRGGRAGGGDTRLRAAGQETFAFGAPGVAQTAAECGEEESCGARLDRGEEATARPPWRAIPPAHRARLERTLLGVALALPPLALAPPGGCPGEVPIAEALTRCGHGVTIRGIVSARRRIRARDGRALVFMTVEDETGMLECVLGAACGGDGAARVDAFVTVRGTMRSNHGAAMLEVSDLRFLGEH